jgi:hypothetical protein
MSRVDRQLCYNRRPMGRGLRGLGAGLFAALGLFVLTAAQPGASASRGACGLPASAPVWIDFADGSVPFWQQIFARPGIVAAASNTTVPPQLREAGAATVYFDLKFPLRVGSPAKPLAPETVQAQADKIFDAAVASTGCQTPVIAENELFGADLVTPWSVTNTQYRANVLAFLTRLAQRGASPTLLISKPPYTDGDAGAWWVQAAKVASIVPEVYFNAPKLSKQGPILASRRLRVAFRTAVTNLTDLGIPASRVGIMLGFQVATGAGGREHLQPSSAWFRVVKWQALAAKQVAAEKHVGTVWSWGWGTWGPASTDADKPAAACVYLWVRSPSLCDGPALAGSSFDASLTEGQILLPAGTRCTVAGQPLTDRAIGGLGAVTGDSVLAESALFGRLASSRSAPIGTRQVLDAEQAIVANQFHGSRSAYLAAVAGAHASLVQARAIIADELRRAAISARLSAPAPTASQIADFYTSYATTQARAVTAKPAPVWLGGRTTGYALEPIAPPQLFALPTRKESKLRTPLGTVVVKPADDAQQLGELPLGVVRTSIADALRKFARDGAYSRWILNRETSALATTICQRDVLPTLGIPELESYLPFVAF